MNDYLSLIGPSNKTKSVKNLKENIREKFFHSKEVTYRNKVTGQANLINRVNQDQVY